MSQDSKVVDKPKLEPEVKDPLTKTLIDLPVEPTIELLSSLTVMRASLRSIDVCDPFHIFLQEIRLQKITLLIVQNVVRSMFITDDLHLLLVIDSTYYLSQAACHGSLFHLHHLGSVMTHPDLIDDS